MDWKCLQNKVLMRIFGPKKGEVAGGWRELHYELLHTLYSLLLERSDKGEMVLYVARMEEKPDESSRK
jgi:hypothetical protein